MNNFEENNSLSFDINSEYKAQGQHQHFEGYNHREDNRIYGEMPFNKQDNFNVFDAPLVKNQYNSQEMNPAPINSPKANNNPISGRNSSAFDFHKLCEDHWEYNQGEETVASRFCTLCNRFICGECGMDNHKTHTDKCEKISVIVENNFTRLKQLSNSTEQEQISNQHLNMIGVGVNKVEEAFRPIVHSLQNDIQTLQNMLQKVKMSKDNLVGFLRNQENKIFSKEIQEHKQNLRILTQNINEALNIIQSSSVAGKERLLKGKKTEEFETYLTQMRQNFKGKLQNGKQKAAFLEENVREALKHLEFKPNLNLSKVNEIEEKVAIVQSMVGEHLLRGNERIWMSKEELRDKLRDSYKPQFNPQKSQWEVDPKEYGKFFGEPENDSELGEFNLFNVNKPYIPVQAAKQEERQVIRQESNFCYYANRGKSLFVYSEGSTKEIPISEFDFDQGVKFEEFPANSRFVNFGAGLFVCGGIINKKITTNAFILNVFVGGENVSVFVENLPGMETARERHNLIYSEDRKTVMVNGGFYTDKVESFNLVEKKWTTHPPLSNKRANATLLYLNKRYVFTVGGFEAVNSSNRSGNYLNSYEIFDFEDPNTAQKLLVPLVNPLKLCAMGVIQTEKETLVVGGFDNTFSKSIYRVETKGDQLLFHQTEKSLPTGEIFYSQFFPVDQRELVSHTRKGKLIRFNTLNNQFICE